MLDFISQQWECLLTAYKYTSAFGICLRNHKFIVDAHSNLPAEKGPKSLHWVGVAFLNYHRIAADLRCSHTAVWDVIRRFCETGSNKDQSRSGRYPCSTPSQDRCALVKVVQNWTMNNHWSLRRVISVMVSGCVHWKVWWADVCQEGNPRAILNLPHFVWQ